MQTDIQDIANHKSILKIEKFANDADYAAGKVFETVDIEGNIFLNTGINQLWTLVCGTGATKFDNTNAYLGVGDSSTASTAGMTDLQASTNKLRVAMNTGYPTYGTSQLAVWQSDFTSAQANYAWQEMGVFNASTAGTMLNRAVSSQGTKTSGQTWRLTLTITIS